MNHLLILKLAKGKLFLNCLPSDIQLDHGYPTMGNTLDFFCILTLLSRFIIFQSQNLIDFINAVK